MKNTKEYTIKGCLFVAMLVFLAFCSVDNTGRVMDDARRFSAVTRTDPSYRPQVGAKLVWYADLIVQDGNSPIKATADQVALVQQTIQAQLIRKGYEFTSDNAQADYTVAAALVMDTSAQSQQIVELVQLFPNLVGAVNDLQPGTLLVVISPPTDPRTAPLLWRGAIQAFAVGEALPEEVRMSRLQSYASRLIDSVPAAGRRD